MSGFILQLYNEYSKMCEYIVILLVTDLVFFTHPPPRIEF